MPELNTAQSLKSEGNLKISRMGTLHIQKHLHTLCQPETNWLNNDLLPS